MVPVSCILVADDCCCVLDGLVCMVLLRWVVFGTMVSVVLMLAEFLHVHDNCFHQLGMIASIKLKTSSVFLPRGLRQNRGTCVCLSCFLSKNENNNGVDTIGLNFPLLD